MNYRFSFLLILLGTLLAACGAPQAVPPTATLLPTATPPPSPTAEPQVQSGVTVAGVDLGGLTREKAQAKLEETLAVLDTPITVQVGSQSVTITPQQIDLSLPLDSLAGEALDATSGTTLTLQAAYDATKLRTSLEPLSSTTPATISIITDTETISRSFAISGGGIDLADAVQQVEAVLSDPAASRAITLNPAGTTRPTPEQLQEQLDQMADEWNGIMGVYAVDLASGQVIGQLNPDTVFSGASIMKLAIMVHAYAKLPSFTEEQQDAMEAMIFKSDNLKANDLLAASIGGTTTEDALKGTESMNVMLKDLGLEHTYQNLPYESGDYLLNILHLKIPKGAAQEGKAPYTEADPYLRTTPREMTTFLGWIEACSQGEGPLIEKFSPNITRARCDEMIELLKQNEDTGRLVAGLPPGTDVAHKSGWTEDMHGDVGIIRSPGGDFLIGIWAYKDYSPSYFTDGLARQRLGALANLVYTYYNPLQQEQ